MSPEEPGDAQSARTISIQDFWIDDLPWWATAAILHLVILLVLTLLSAGGTRGEWGYRGGRVYSTALAAMTLEVYYRFRVVESNPGAADRP